MTGLARRAQVVERFAIRFALVLVALASIGLVLRPLGQYPITRW